MEVTETMDTETYNVREALRRFYGSKKIAEMDEEIAQKAEERAEQIAEQKVEETVQKLEAEQKRKTKRECKKAFKAGEESGFKSGEERTTISVVTRMFNNGFTVKSIMSICDLSEQDVIAIRDHGCLPQH